MTSSSERSRFDSVVLAACLLLAFAARLTAILSQPDQLTQDRDVYLGIATSVAEGRGFCGPNATAPTAFRPPLYPVCLALGLCLFPPAGAVAGINLLAGLLTVWLTARLGAALQLGRLRFVAAGLVAIDPLLLRYASQPMTESFCTYMATFWLWSVVALSPKAVCLNSKGTGAKAAWISGAAFGSLVLSRPTFWPIAIFCGLNWLVTRRQTSTGTPASTAFASDGAALSSCIATLLVVTPWLLRNGLVFGTTILTTTHGGYTLLLGNNPVYYEQVVHQPWGTTWPDSSQQAWEVDLRTHMDHDLGPNSTEVERDNWQSGQAKANMAADPWSCAAAAIHRVHSLWNTTPLGPAASGVNQWAVFAVGWFYFCVLGAGLLGMSLVLLRSDRLSWWPLYALIVGVQLVHLFYWTDTRMRAPLTPAIALFAVALFVRGRLTIDKSSHSLEMQTCVQPRSGVGI